MGIVISVSCDDRHNFSKHVVPEIRLIAGLGVVGDAHNGNTVRHRSRVAVDPSQPNLRQVHLIHSELFSERAVAPFYLKSGDLGENILTANIDLLSLPTGTRLHIGASVELEVTGLRNPCSQIESFRPGLLKAVLDGLADGTSVRKAGIMSVVVTGGIVRASDAIEVILPPPPHLPLERV